MGMTEARGPKSLTRVVWAESAPHIVERHRNFERPEDAARQVAAIRCWPDRAHLVSVSRTECQWTDVDLDTLPLPEADAAKYDTLNESETP